MIKIAFATATFLVAACTSAFADSKVWNVTEQSASGIKSAQGTWTVNTDSANKVTGSANMQFDNGNTLTYALEGAVAENVYTLRFGKRTDGKNGCVWTGHPQTDGKPVLRGEVKCDGSTFQITAGT